MIISESKSRVFYNLPVASEADSKEDDNFELGKLIEEEAISSGAVSPRIYWEFIMAALWATVLGTLLLYALCQALRMTADYFLSNMVNCGMQIKVAELSNSTEVSLHTIFISNYSILTCVERT